MVLGIYYMYMYTLTYKRIASQISWSRYFCRSSTWSTQNNWMSVKYQAQSHEWISHLKGIRVLKCLTSELCWVCHNSYFSLTSCRPIFLQLRQDPRDEIPPWQEVLDGENEIFPQSIIKVVFLTFPDNDVFELVRTIEEFEEKLPKLNLSSSTGQWEEAAIVFLVEIRAACN